MVYHPRISSCLVRFPACSEEEELLHGFGFRLHVRFLAGVVEVLNEQAALLRASLYGGRVGGVDDAVVTPSLHECSVRHAVILVAREQEYAAPQLSHGDVRTEVDEEVAVERQYIVHAVCPMAAFAVGRRFVSHYDDGELRRVSAERVAQHAYHGGETGVCGKLAVEHRHLLHAQRVGGEVWTEVEGAYASLPLLRQRQFLRACYVVSRERISVDESLSRSSIVRAGNGEPAYGHIVAYPS